MNPTLLIVLCLIFLFGIIAFGIANQYRRYSAKYRGLAEALCDPDTWRISFHVRSLLLKGQIQGTGMRYAVLGDERKREPVNTHLLLEYPVKHNFRFYFSSDPELAPPDLRDRLAAFQELPDFRGLTFISPDTPAIAAVLARPLGFGRAPGILLWKWGTSAFDADGVRHDFLMLLDLAKQDG
jgi:hypothetical protein